MKVLLIGTDEKAFDKNSPVRERLKGYSKYVESLTSLVLVKSSKNEVEEGNLKIIPVLNTGKISSFLKLLRIVKKYRGSDIISTQDPAMLGLIGYLASKSIGAKLHVQIHTDIASSEYTKNIRGKIEWCVARFVIKKTKKIRAVSLRIIENIGIRMSVDRVAFSILPIYVNPLPLGYEIGGEIKDRLESFTANHGIIILILSRLESEKRILESVKIFASISRGGHKMGLVIVGDGSQKNEIEKLVGSCDIQNDVLFFDWTRTPSFFYERCDILWNNSRFEGFGMTLVEACLSGTPIISSDVGIAKDVIIEGVNGFLYQVDDTKKVTRILECIGENPTFLKAMKGKRGNIKNVINYENEEEYAKKITEDWESALL